MLCEDTVGDALSHTSAFDVAMMVENSHHVSDTVYSQP